MTKLQRILRDKRGETLVEVLLSIILFLLLLAVLSTAVGFASQAQQRAEENRDSIASYQRQLRTIKPSDDDKGQNYVEYSFNATSPDGLTQGDLVFKVKVKLMERAISPEGGGAGTIFRLFFTELQPTGGIT